VINVVLFSDSPGSFSLRENYNDCVGNYFSLVARQLRVVAVVEATESPATEKREVISHTFRSVLCIPFIRVSTTRQQIQNSQVLIKRAFFSPGNVKSKPQLRKNTSDDVIAMTSRMSRFRARSTHSSTSIRPTPLP